MFATHGTDLRDRKLSSATLKREEVSVAKTTVPKKGLIKLTALDNEIQNPFIYDKKDHEGKKKHMANVHCPSLLAVCRSQNL